MSAGIRHSRDGAISILAFDRPEKKNAITDAMYGALVDGLRAAETDDTIKVVVITGAADVFTAGNDIVDFLQCVEAGRDLEEWHAPHFIMTLGRFRKPVVAAVSGAAVGIGTTLLLHCDLVVLGESARLAVPFMKLGLPPEAAASRLLPERIGHVRAFELFALGETLDASTALSLGLANRVVPDKDVFETAMTMARTLAARPAQALFSTKALMRDADKIRAQMSAELELFFKSLRSPEARAAFQAFLQR